MKPVTKAAAEGDSARRTRHKKPQETKLNSAHRWLLEAQAWPQSLL